jgi:hypothetical protein
MEVFIMNKQKRIGKMVQEIRESLDRIKVVEPLFDEYTSPIYSESIYSVEDMYGDDYIVTAYMELYEAFPNLIGLRCNVSRPGSFNYTTTSIRGSKNEIEKGVEVLDKMIIADIGKMSKI